MESRKSLFRQCQKFAYAVRCGIQPTPEAVKKNEERLKLLKDTANTQNKKGKK